MPADLTDFDANIRPPGQPLRIDTILAQLPEQRQADLRTALSMTEKYNAPLIAKTLTEEWGIPVGEAAVRTWRRRNLAPEHG